MNNTIPKEDIELLKHKIDIVELIGGYVNLSNAGESFKGLCPFHSEKDGSFVVNPKRNNYTCFGCGVNGDAIEFIMEMESMDFKTAYNFLVEKYGGKKLEPPKSKKSKSKKAANFVSLPRDEALKIYDPIEVLRKATKLINKKGDIENIEIAENGWFPYYNADNYIDIMIIRFNHSIGKDVLPFAWSGEFLFMSKIPVLLYNRHLLAQHPDKPVIIHEGEKCANIGAEKLPNFVHTTWNGGGKKFKYIQGLEILAGRDCYLLSDDDQKTDLRSGKLFPPEKQPGWKTMSGLKIILEKI